MLKSDVIQMPILSFLADSWNKVGQRLYAKKDTKIAFAELVFVFFSFLVALFFLKFFPQSSKREIPLKDISVNFFEYCIDYFQAFFGKIASFFKSIPDFLRCSFRLFNTFLKYIFDFLTKLYQLFISFFKLVSQFLTKLYQLFISFLKLIPEFFRCSVQLFTAFFKSIFALKQLIKNFFASLPGFFTCTCKLFRSFFRNIRLIISLPFKCIKNTFSMKNIKCFFNFCGQCFKVFFNTSFQLILKIFRGILYIICWPFKFLWEKIKGLWNIIISWFNADICEECCDCSSYKEENEKLRKEIENLQKEKCQKSD